MDISLQQIGNRIRGRRKEKHWTQAELADRAGTTQQTISVAERGVKMLQLDNLIGISIALDCTTADYLLFGKNPPVSLDALNIDVRTLNSLHRECLENIVRSFFAAISDKRS